MQSEVYEFLKKKGSKFSINELCDRLGINPQTINQNINKLIKRGIIDYCLVSLPYERRTYKVFWATDKRVEKLMDIYRPKTRQTKEFITDINEFRGVEIHLIKFMTRVHQLKQQLSIIEKNKNIIDEMKDKIILSDGWKTFPAKDKVLEELRYIEKGVIK